MLNPKHRNNKIKTEAKKGRPTNSLMYRLQEDHSSYSYWYLCVHSFVPTNTGARPYLRSPPFLFDNNSGFIGKILNAEPNTK
jgi:hypothetical protein